MEPTFFYAHKIDALLVTRESNIRYLSVFKGTHGYVLITDRKNYLLTDPRYLEKAQSTVPQGWEVVDVSDGLLNVLHTLLVRHKVKQLGVESAHVTMLLAKRLATLNGIKLIETIDAIETVRMVKTAAELRLIRQSQKLNEQLLKLALSELKVGISEAQMAWRIRLIAHDLGAGDLSFAPIVAFGGHTARPHHEPQTGKKLKRGDMVLFDIGLCYKEYASDLTRTFFTKNPTSEQADVYQTVLTAQQAAILAAKPGAKADDIDRAARLFISDSGYKKKFGHATGHGVGMDVHELPRVAKTDMTTLSAGMVLAIEPGIYLPGKLGVRIEDMVEITGSGNKVLNTFPKDPASARIRI